MLLETSHSLHPKKRVMSSLFGHRSSSKSLTATNSPAPPARSRSFSPPKILSRTEENIDASEAIITKWDDKTKATSLFQHSRRDAREFVQSVKDLRRAMHCLVSENSASGRLVLAQRLMQTAMKRLERELYLILSENRNRLDPNSISGRSAEDEEDDPRPSEVVDESFGEVERVSEPAMSDLKSIAECMIVCGYGKECIRIYKMVRQSMIEEEMFRLKIERFGSSQIHKMSWEALVGTIENWRNAAEIAVRKLFSGEKILCDHVFAVSDTIRQTCFHEIMKEAAMNLFRFPELVAKSKKSLPEKIFRLMELYETVSDLLPEIEAIFSSESTSDIRLEALSSALKLRDSIHTILPDFEMAIHKDYYSSKALVSGGGIDPMTRSVMGYISSLADHSVVLSGILSDYPPPGNLQTKESYLDTPTDPASVHLAWLVLVLLCKLDCKAELYKDASLSYLFLSNNLQFVVEKVRATSLKPLLGEDWLSKHSKKVQQYAASYESMAWTKVFFSLPDHHTAHSSPLPSAAAKEIFEKFGAAFEEQYMKQRSWVVQDGKLRDELKVSIAKKLVPKYREFYDSNIGELRAEAKNPATSAARFSPDGLENYLSDLFHGVSASGSSKSPQRWLSH